MAGQRQHLGLAHEAFAAVAALALSLIVVAHLVTTERVSLLYSDGDSVITVLVARSLSSGEPQDWAMSSVLFLPEVAVYWLLSLLGLSIMATLTLNAVINFLALYAAVRFIARGLNSEGPIGSLAAFAAFAGLALLDGSGSRESLELASLLATTTYYSATVVAVLVTLGLVVRVPLRVPALVALCAVAVVSTASNPIYLVWAVLPFALLLIAARHLPVRARVLALTTLVAGAAIGMLVRVPLAPWITNTGVGYAQPTDWRESAGYYGDLVADRAEDAGGVVSLLLWCLLMLLGIALTVVGLRRRQPAIAMLAGVAWMAPLLVIVGAIALGTHAARYVQPAVFLPIVALVALAGVLPPVHRLVVPVAAVVLAVVAVILIPGLAREAAREHPSADVACVTQWVAESGEVGAGQFWSVRAPKAYAEDPAALVQLDFQLNAYAWLVNRTDFAVERVSFLVTDGSSFPFELPPRLASATTETVDCGSYTITDFGRPIVVIGPPHS